ncbi:hypothetical protein T440DRAFT_404706, partial [Plenodomus tracheiphilus IPT5]
MIVRSVTVSQVYLSHLRTHTHIYTHTHKRSNMWLSESASYGCDHHYSPIFFIVHKSSEAFACAPCLVRSCVSEIKSAQAGLEACGGVLFSKISGQKDGMDHKGWRTKLRSDKIRCYNVVR